MKLVEETRLMRKAKLVVISLFSIGRVNNRGFP